MALNSQGGILLVYSRISGCLCLKNLGSVCPRGWGSEGGSMGGVMVGVSGRRGIGRGWGFGGLCTCMGLELGVGRGGAGDGLLGIFWCCGRFARLRISNGIAIHKLH